MSVSVTTRPIASSLSASSYILAIDVADTTDGVNGTMKRITPYSLTLMRQDVAKSNYFFGDGGNTTNAGGACVGGGWRALLSAVYCTDMTVLGDQAAMSYVGSIGTPIVGCTHIGKFSGQYCVSGTNNTGCGDSTLRNALGTGNTAMGYVTANGIINAQYGVWIGAGAGAGSDMGNYVTIVGFAACPTNASYSLSTIVGAQAKSGGGGGTEECGFGYQTLWYSSVGKNAAFGVYSGFQITVGYRNCFFGESCGSNALQKVDAINTIGLGALTYTTKDNQVVCGNSSIVETNLRGKTVINSSLGTPRAWLDVIGSDAIYIFGASGTSTGIRIATNSTQLQLQAVDSTLGAAYTQLELTGAGVILNSTSGTNVLTSGNLITVPAASITLTANGQMAFQATSNTTATLKYRGSDGTTRSVALTLA
jgi:hypothetical protein